MRWISLKAAAAHYAVGNVAFELGAHRFTLRGGINARSGARSQLEIASIIGLSGGAFATQSFDWSPALKSRRVFRRDRHLCAYCGQVWSESDLTIDHVNPVSRGGVHRWENALTACRGCNQAKADRTPEEWGHPPLFLPYRPGRHEGLILMRRHVLADQMEFLLAGAPKHSRLLAT